ncbi:zinc finger and BTB domain-containing protein 49-like, partial [Contarinia nasturtii]|uniref:zinc finger and BTB domain-containing protein 49-like n=1 Tax=Contarinia nasturtii TaxID=265458 RepID=UPI0012D40DBE
MIIPTVVPEANVVDQGSDMNEPQSMANTTAFHELSVIQIPGDETIQRFASIVSKNIGENNVRASLGAILGNESMSAKFDEPQATLTNGNGMSEDDMRNSIAVNGMSKGVMTNDQPDTAISEYDEIIVTNASELETIHADRPNNLPVVDLTIENVKAQKVNNQKEKNQVKTNQRKRKIAEASTLNGNSKKKRKIEPRLTQKTIPESTSESPLIDVTSKGRKSSKQSKGVHVPPNQRNETKSTDAEHQKGSTSNGKSNTKCEFCNYVAYPSQLIVHRRIHTGEKPFICKICAKGFTRTYVLKTHMRTHANKFPFHCSICRQGFAVKWEKETHEKNCNQR